MVTRNLFPSLRFSLRTAGLALLLTLAALPAWAAGTLIISEFRLQGPNGFADEYIEIYNNSGADHTVAAISGTGYAIAASDGIVRCTILNGTVIPNRGHWLCANSIGYSLSSYPAGNGTTATPDGTYTLEITDGEDPDGAGGNPPLPRQGIALFNNNTGGGSFSLANRFDAVGPVSEANALYKEGTGLPNLTPFAINYAWVRDECGNGGSITGHTPCTISTPKDTDNNAADFYFVDTNGTSAGGGQRLGAPGPQNLSSPVTVGSFASNRLDATVGDYDPPNVVRDFTSDGPNNSTFGTISIRRRFVNTTGGNVTRLRFRITGQSTFPAPSGTADLRNRTSSLVVVAGINDAATCAATGTPATPPCTVSVQGTTLEQPPSQPNGSAFNSSMSAGTVTLATPLANGASINLQFLFGLQQTGNYHVNLDLEGLPQGGGSTFLAANTDNPIVLSIVRANPSPTAAASVDFTVTFSKAVTGVDSADFALTATGSVAGASVTGVAGSGAVYTVTVNTGAGSGTLRLDVTDNDSITATVGAALLGGAGAGNGNFTSGEVYTIDKTSFTGTTGTGTGSATASFTGGGAGCAFSGPQFIAAPPGAPPVPPVAPPNVTFPQGLFTFSTTGCTVGSTLSFTIVFPQPLSPGTQYWKYGPTAGNPAAHWYVLPATIVGNTVTFTITDGGLGDDDLTANGTIVDQGGPGVTVTQVPTLSEWAMLLLALLLLAAGLPYLRRR